MVSIFTALCVLLCHVVPYLLRGFVSRSLLMIASSVLLFVLTSMASLAHRFSWHQEGSVTVQVSIFVIVVALGVFLYRLRRMLLHVVVAAYFLSGMLITTAADDAAMFSDWREARDPAPGDVDGQRAFGRRSRLYALTTGRKALRTPNIYLLTYDAYVENETMLQ